MGIQKLMELIRQHASSAIRQRDPKYYAGNTIACDASMAMYQFIIAGVGYDDHAMVQMTDSQGNKTGHLLGLWNRTLSMLDAGIKPVWVFDGPPPTKKNGELLRRKRIKEEAEQKFEEAKDIGDLANAIKQQQKATRITKEQRNDAVKMLRLMGLPVIEAPGEAEAQCAALNKAGKVDGVATEDMDALTFGAKLLLRNFQNMSKKQPITEINYETLLSQFKMTRAQFVDLCILCGCDYLPKIEGIGPVKAFKMIHQFKSLQKVVEHIESENKGKQKPKYGLPKAEDYQYQQARDLFNEPKVNVDVEINFQKEFDEAALRKFLVEEKNFFEGRVDGGIKRLKTRPSGLQTRLQSFFGKATLVKSSIGQKQKEKKLKTKKK